MIFVTGPAFSGKEAYVRGRMHWNEAQFREHAVCDAERLAYETDALEKLANSLAKKQVVIASETGAGVVPVDATERKNREAAGRLACLLAERADTVVRVVCGLPQVLKDPDGSAGT